MSFAEMTEGSRLGLYSGGLHSAEEMEKDASVKSRPRRTSAKSRLAHFDHSMAAMWSTCCEPVRNRTYKEYSSAFNCSIFKPIVCSAGGEKIVIHLRKSLRFHFSNKSLRIKLLAKTQSMLLPSRDFDRICIILQSN